jgi:hypothetical protein
LTRKSTTSLNRHWRSKTLNSVVVVVVVVVVGGGDDDDESSSE